MVSLHGHIFDNVYSDTPYESEGVLYCPWINKENVEESVKAIKSSKAKYCLGHFELLNFEMMRGFECKSSLISNDIFDDFEQVISGHFHNYSKKGNIEYLGSCMEFNWSDYGEQKFLKVIGGEEDKLIPIPLTFHSIVTVDNFSKEFSKSIKFEDYLDKKVKVVLQCERTKELDKWLEDFSAAVGGIQIVNKFELVSRIGKKIDIQELNFVDVWKEYLGCEEELSESDKECVDEVFQETYKKVVMG
jgi:DNA repair exonuclease SbcCD nuclease subunit